MEEVIKRTVAGMKCKILADTRTQTNYLVVDDCVFKMSTADTMIARARGAKGLVVEVLKHRATRSHDHDWVTAAQFKGGKGLLPGSSLDTRLREFLAMKTADIKTQKPTDTDDTAFMNGVRYTIERITKIMEETK